MHTRTQTPSLHYANDLLSTWTRTLADVPASVAAMAADAAELCRWHWQRPGRPQPHTTREES